MHTCQTFYLPVLGIFQNLAFDLNKDIVCYVLTTVVLDYSSFCFQLSWGIRCKNVKHCEVISTVALWKEVFTGKLRLLCGVTYNQLCNNTIFNFTPFVCPLRTQLLAVITFFRQRQFPSLFTVKSILKIW